MQPPPKDNRFEFVVLAGQRARQLFRGAVPREPGEKRGAESERLPWVSGCGVPPDTGARHSVDVRLS